MVLFRPCDMLARAQEKLGGENYIFSLSIFVIYKEAVFLKSAPVFQVSLAALLCFLS